jgi:hypothetical protein
MRSLASGSCPSPTASMWMSFFNCATVRSGAISTKNRDESPLRLHHRVIIVVGGIQVEIEVLLQRWCWHYRDSDTEG